jgi:hypothetical protein
MGEMTYGLQIFEAIKNMLIRRGKGGGEKARTG